MLKKIPVLLFLFLTISMQAQQIRLRGNVADSSGRNPLPNALLMAIRFSDSTLVNFSRTNANGIFKPIAVPPDTYIVILSHPGFNDKTYLLLPSKTDSAFNFKNVVLPPKSFELNEVEVIAYREKSYYKGDTLIFTADSFKTQANATVEDLLKKLPGVRVDAKGKITIQGKEVDQVLVDGDEFFGSDPTVATRNLNASSIENVQVYDKKNESTAEGQNETLKVVNLKMKDDAKKGYFGKVSGASDFNKFYENELLANRFKGSRKMSVFGIVANTPKQAFGWSDAEKYGLSGETPYSYNDDSGQWTSNNNGTGTGIPQTIKTGFYFNDKLSKKTKLNTDYTFNQNQLQTGTQTNTQFFLADTSYSDFKQLSGLSKNQVQNFNLRLTQKIDSLTELVVAPKLKYAVADNNSFQRDDFHSQTHELTRSTTIGNSNHTESMDANVLFRLNRNFMKKDRTLTLTYQPIYNSSNNTTKLNTDFIYYKGQQADSSSYQRRTQSNFKLEHNVTGIYVEPLSKKFKVEVNYNFVYNHNANNRKTYLVQTGNDVFNPALSNNFDNLRMINRAGTKLIYEVKKYKIAIGSYFRNVQQENTNLSTGQKLSLNVNNILPLANFNYRIGQASNLTINYNTSSQQPDLQQMQPVIDNTDPNRITIGNPNLKPTFSNNGNLNYYFYKGVSDVNFYGGLSGGNTNNQISYATTYDSQGKAVSQPVNVNGNYNGNMYLGGGFPLFKRFMKMYYNLGGSFNNNVSYVNGIKNISQNKTVNPGLTFEKTIDKFNMTLNGEYTYSLPKSNISIRSNQPYYTYSIDGNLSMKLPGKFVIAADGKYTNNGNRTPGYNLNFFILNASVSKNFLKNENLVVSLIANDVLNQNISNQRYITSNQIVDTKTQIIRRYFLLKILFKFNNQNTKVDDDER